MLVRSVLMTATGEAPGDNRTRRLLFLRNQLTSVTSATLYLEVLMPLKVLLSAAVSFISRMLPYRTTITSLVLISLMATACSHATATRSAHPGTTTRVVDASWAEGYPTLQQMTAHSVAVDKIVITHIVKRGIFSQSSSTSSAIPYTDFAGNVLATAKGPTKRTITIRQTGGTDRDGNLVAVKDDPLLVVGAQAVVFLKSAGPNLFYILGGPAGRLNIDTAGVVHALPGGSMIQPPTGSAQNLITRLRAIATAQQ